MDLSKLGRKIQKLRLSRNMTQKELASFLGYSESFISYIEKGLRKISAEDIEKISKIFAVDRDYLLQGSVASHFRANDNNQNDTNYDDMMDDFFLYINNRK